MPPAKKRKTKATATTEKEVVPSPNVPETGSSAASEEMPSITAQETPVQENAHVEAFGASDAAASAITYQSLLENLSDV